jgi:hypothetical protein
VGHEVWDGKVGHRMQPVMVKVAAQTGGVMVHW